MTGGSSAPWAAVLFDLDGTLADTVDLILKCFRYTAGVHMSEVPSDSRFLRGIGMPLRRQLAEFSDDPGEVTRMAETYAAYQRSIHDEMVAPFPGAASVVAGLKEKGVYVGVVTSKRRGMAQRTLQMCGLADSLDVLVGADDVKNGKPDPEPVLLALEQLGLSGSAPRTLFVGDSPYDMAAGREAGTQTAAALWGPFSRDVLEGERPDFFVNDLPSILELRR